MAETHDSLVSGGAVKKCRRGHPLTPDNVVRDGERWRCRACRIRGQVAARARRKDRERAGKAAEVDALRQRRRQEQKDAQGRGRMMVSAASAAGALGKIDAAAADRGKPLATAVVLQRVEDLIRDTDASLTPEKIALSTPKDLVTMLAILIDKRQILRGEPTQRVSVEIRAKLDELGPLLLGEMKRRGLKTVDAEFREVEGGP